MSDKICLPREHNVMHTLCVGPIMFTCLCGSATITFNRCQIIQAHWLLVIDYTATIEVGQCIAAFTG